MTELLVTMLIFGVVLAAIMTLSIGFMKTNGQTTTRQNQVDTARVVVETVSRNLRTAVMPSQLTSTCSGCTQDAFVVGKDFAVQFYANINNPGNSVGPSRVTYTLSTSGTTAGDLVEKIQVPDSNVPTASGYVYCDAEAVGASATCKARLKTRTVAKGVQSSGQPIFAYYDGVGARLSPATAGGSLSSLDLSHVLSVELMVSVQAKTGIKVDPTTYIQRLTLPNAQAVLRQEETP
ncbi:PilW family protein [Cellulomonas sp. ICMP 17802]|uniref:PilW family protein n=1 Tax=Cellulomonas sp. ICMP 17802 TaxID=3239199 RepID=UPI00351B786A